MQRPPRPTEDSRETYADGVAVERPTTSDAATTATSAKTARADPSQNSSTDALSTSSLIEQQTVNLMTSAIRSLLDSGSATNSTVSQENIRSRQCDKSQLLSCCLRHLQSLQNSQNLAPPSDTAADASKMQPPPMKQPYPIDIPLHRDTTQEGLLQSRTKITSDPPPSSCRRSSVDLAGLFRPSGAEKTSGKSYGSYGAISRRDLSPTSRQRVAESLETLACTAGDARVRAFRNKQRFLLSTPSLESIQSAASSTISSICDFHYQSHLRRKADTVARTTSGASTQSLAPSEAQVDTTAPHVWLLSSQEEGADGKRDFRR